MDWSPILAELPKAVPYTIGALVGGLLAFIAQYLTHRYTQRREDGKLLREKAEELIHTLGQTRHSTAVLCHGLIRDMAFSNPSQRGVIGSVSLEPFNESLAKDGRRRLPEPGEYQASIQTIYWDSQRADTLQRLYFPSLQRCYKAYSDALIPLLDWLRKHVALQVEDPLHWPEQFRADSTEAQLKLLTLQRHF